MENLSSFNSLPYLPSLSISTDTPPTHSHTHTYERISWDEFSNFALPLAQLVCFVSLFLLCLVAIVFLVQLIHVYLPEVTLQRVLRHSGRFSLLKLDTNDRDGGGLGYRFVCDQIWLVTCQYMTSFNRGQSTISTWHDMHMRYSLVPRLSLSFSHFFRV